MPGTMELLIIFGIILLVFGASRLPKIARSMGESVGEFKEGLQGDEEPDDQSIPEDLENETDSRE